MKGDKNKKGENHTSHEIHMLLLCRKWQSSKFFCFCWVLFGVQIADRRVKTMRNCQEPQFGVSGRLHECMLRFEQILIEWGCGEVAVTEKYHLADIPPANSFDYFLSFFFLLFNIETFGTHSLKSYLS